MELAIPRQNDGPEYSRVTKRFKDATGAPIAVANDNPLMDMHLYEVE